MAKNQTGRSWRWWLGGCVVIILLVWGIDVLSDAMQWAPYSIVSAPNTDKRIDPADDAGPEELSRLGISRQMRVEAGPPAASLSVWMIDPTNTPRATILVIHGVQDKKRSMVGSGKMFAAAGYRAVLMDLRGHGRSSGQWLTYGWLESRDLKQVVDELSRQGLLVGKLGIYGVSYGGATAIMEAGIDPRVQAVVTVAPFATMRTEIHHYVRQASWGILMSDSKINKAIEDAGRIANFDPDEASPLEAIPKVKAHVLIFHGKFDQKINYQQSEALHAAAPEFSELILVEGKDYDSIVGDENSPVYTKSVPWFERWLVNQ